jgi:hypothetical protein
MYDYKLYQETLTEVIKLNKAAVFDALASAGITDVTVEFDGWGDSGQIEAITAQSGDITVELPSGRLRVHRPVETTGPVEVEEQALRGSYRNLVLRLAGGSPCRLGD